MRKFDVAIIDLIESTTRNYKTHPLNLGGVAGSGGGPGGPPGGYVGYLPQRRVAYDTDEFATLDTPASGMSLKDNLNHIRYRIQTLESGVMGSGMITVVDDDTLSSYENINTIHFSGAGVLVADLGGGEVRVSVDATGSGGAALTVEEYDGSPVVSNVDRIIFSGALVTDLGGGDVRVDILPPEIVTSSGTAKRQAMLAINGELTTQSSPRRIYNRTGQELVIEKVYISTDDGGAPTGAAIIVDVNKGVEDASPTTIFTNQANRPQIAASTEIGYTNVIDVDSWGDGEYLQVDIDQIGSTIPGSGLDVVVISRDTVPTIVFSGGGGATAFLDLSDVPNSYAGKAGQSVVVNGTEDGLEFTTISGGSGTTLELRNEGTILGTITSLDVVGAGISASIAGSDGIITLSGFQLHKYNEDITPQIPGSGFTTELVYLSGTLRVYYNGIRQRKDVHYVEDWQNAAFTTLFTVASGNYLIVDYDYTSAAQLVDGWGLGRWGEFPWPFGA